MHRLPLFLLLLAGCGTASQHVTDRDARSAATVGAASPDVFDFVDAPGVVRTLEVGDSTPLFVVYPDEEPDARYCLATEELPEDLRRDGARVVFTGNREEIPANHRMACSPLDLEDIEEE